MNARDGGVSENVRVGGVASLLSKVLQDRDNQR